MRGEPGLMPALMQRLYGSDDLFPDDRMHAFHPYQSVNFVTSHDGFTLYDLVSYEQKHNDANGNANTDGTNENYSWNCGWEGDQEVPDHVLQLRRRQAKNFCALLMLANGTPMFRAGDEFLQTQGGNNNPYNQDNATSWLDWDRLRTHQEVFRFFRAMIRFRKEHPSLARSRFWRDDVRWFGTGHAVDMGPGSRTLAIYLSGASQHDADLYVMINTSHEDATFQIQEGPLKMAPGSSTPELASQLTFMRGGSAQGQDLILPRAAPLRRRVDSRPCVIAPDEQEFPSHAALLQPRRRLALRPSGSRLLFVPPARITWLMRLWQSSREPRTWEGKSHDRAKTDRSGAIRHERAPNDFSRAR